MPQQDPFGLIGIQVEQTTSHGWSKRGTIKAVLADGRVIVELDDKQIVEIDPEKDEEWKLVG